ncbi:MAG TPA: hypothetical protein PKV97_05990 [Thauera aminoaromatica]|nr:hypothetical protein [Thauera aminoaromatica]
MSNGQRGDAPQESRLVESIKSPHAQPSPALAVTRRWSVVVVLVSVMAALLVYAALPRDMGELGRRAVGIAVFAAALWATEAIPLFPAWLSIVGLDVLLLSRGGERRAGGHGQPQLHPVLRAVRVEHGHPVPKWVPVDRGGAEARAGPRDRLAVGAAVRRRLYRLVMAVILTTGFLSIWISNTATAAMMLAIVTPLARNPATPRRLGSRHAAVTLFAAADAIRCLASIPSASDVHHRRDAKPPRRLESAHDAPNDTKVHSWSYHS